MIPLHRRSRLKGYPIGCCIGLALFSVSLCTASAQPIVPTGIVLAQLETAPLPRPHPERTVPDAIEEPTVEASPPAIPAVALPQPDFLFMSAFRRFEAGDFGSAVRIARSMADGTGLAVINWLIATEGYPRANFAEVSAAVAAVPEWPGQTLMEIRYEQALIRSDPSASEVVAAMTGRTPEMESTTLLLARSLVGTGREADAQTLVRRYWREANFSLTTEEALLAEFGAMLRDADHHWRMSRLLYAGSNTSAVRTSALLGEDMVALASAWAAANEGSGNATARLAAVPESLRTDPGYQYARLRQFIRSGNLREAATLLQTAPSDADLLIDPEAWSVQRRTLAWSLVQRGEAALAYDILAEHPAIDRAEIVEVEFQAGWVALRRLADPIAAEQHFRSLLDSSSLPLSQSRGAYWLGRSLAAAGRPDEALDAFRTAAAFPTTYYGQLALHELGDEALTIAGVPEVDDAVRASFEANPYVKAMGWLQIIDRPVQVDLFARYLADQLTDPAEIALLAQSAADRGDHQLALQIGKLAANRGLAVDAVAFPMNGIPPGVRSDRVDMAFVYAIARQESAFNTNAVSAAGARGLLQLLPSTAREAARSLSLTYTDERLTADPAFNAIVGGAYIRTLLDRYDGSVVLALAAYNAGLSRVDGWLATYGDPRRDGVDPIDWIERIPFSETRNYVQRVMENLEVYRALLGDPQLRIADDLGLR